MIELGPALVRFTGRAEGDLGHAGAYVNDVAPDVAARRAAVVDRPWSWLRQVHGARVVQVDGPGGGAGETADAAVTRRHDGVLSVLVADCAPVALAAPEGVVAVVHAGWRGLVAGVIEAAVAAMRDLGAGEVVAALGPCIHAECYEFGDDDLALVAGRLGDGVRGVAASGHAALDVPAGVKAALDAAGAHLAYEDARCTSCHAADLFSYRARGEAQRQAVVAWLP